MASRIFTTLAVLFSLAGSFVVIKIPARDLMEIAGSWGGGDPGAKRSLEARIERDARLAKALLIIGAAFALAGVWAGVMGI